MTQTKSKFRIKEFDLVNDVHILQKHLFWFVWKDVGAGSKRELESKIKELAA